MSARIGDWICTASGRSFYPLDPRADELAIEDIAHALALICRFTGHCRCFYSVAEHSVRVSVEIERRRLIRDGEGVLGVALAGLLHDASEAYLVDVARPVKRDPQMAFYRAAEKRLQALIYATFLPEPMDALDTVIHLADNILLATEKRDLMPARTWNDEPLRAWASLPDPLPDVIEPWPPAEAEARFLLRFAECNARLRDHHARRVEDSP